MIELAVKGTRIYTPDGPRAGAVLVENGKIADIVNFDEVPGGLKVNDVGDLAVIPSLVDAHVHVGEPGRTAWEGYLTATRAAAAGGVGTIVDMPLSCSPATTTRRALKAKLDSAKGKLTVDAAFWGGLVPGNLDELRPMAADGVVGFKAFLAPGGLDEFPGAARADLEAAMPALASLGLPLIVHAELEPGSQAGPDPRKYSSYLASRPDSMEVRAVRLMIELCRKTGCRTHIAHVSSAEALPDIEKAKAEGLPLTAETCPHYLTFAADGIPDGAVQFKCAPPIRSEENRELLWRALGRGVIDFVASGHSPCAPELKKFDAGDFTAARDGIAGLQFTLPAAWSGAKRRGFQLEDVVRWTAERPAGFAGLKTKGRLEKGRDADLVILDDAALFDVEPSGVLHRHKVTAYAGLRLQGAVAAHYQRGAMIYEAGEFPAGRRGRALLKGSETWTGARS
ncbi:MAG: allantoinase AllB [Elusimicrobia bacterium]|nr:allantoinase AllB [Elusimicrobiota bacterium]